MATGDEAIVHACVAGDQAAWRDFVQKYARLILLVIGRTSGHYGRRLTTEETDDLCAEIFYALVKDGAAKLRAYNPQYSLTTYLGVIARSVTIDFLRSRRGPRTTGEEHDPAASSVLGLDDIADGQAVNPEDPLEREEAARAVNDVLASLSTREQLVVKLFYFNGKKYREIADMLDIPLNTVCSTLARALEKLGDRLKKLPGMEQE